MLKSKRAENTKIISTRLKFLKFLKYILPEAFGYHQSTAVCNETTKSAIDFLMSLMKQICKFRDFDNNADWQHSIFCWTMKPFSCYIENSVEILIITCHGSSECFEILISLNFLVKFSTLTYNKINNLRWKLIAVSSNMPKLDSNGDQDRLRVKLPQSTNTLHVIKIDSVFRCLTISGVSVWGFWADLNLGETSRVRLHSETSESH